ncbi:MAG: choice-of-anchor J domain-containing protein [Bacteroidales bacterium]
MKRNTYILLIYLVFGNLLLKAQDSPLTPKLIGHGVFLGETPPLRDLPAVTEEEIAFLKEKAFKKAARKVIKPREYPFEATAFPKSADALWQKTMGVESSLSKAPLVNFEGQTTSSFPPDCNGTAGPNHYMQTVNTTYAIYSKTGTLMAGPTNMNLLFNGVSGATCNDGDPLIQYDEQAQRWLAVEFSLCGTNDLMLIAVSSSSDPTGTWYAYSFDVTDMPDYEKIGVWQDGYYMGTNTSTGNDIYVFERSKMLTGAANPQMVAFDNSWRPGSGFLCVPPLDNDGVAAPAGSPGLFIAFNDDAVAGGSDQLWVYELAVNWTSPASSTFNRTQQIAVTAFDSQFTSSWDDITQPGTQKLDGVPQVIMNAPQYRNFGSYQTIVCCHTVDVDATNHAGIRWYELRKTTPATTWAIRQSGTYAPDASSRWMGSIMLNGSGKIGLAYSIASSSIYPGIRYCGQSSAAYSNASGVLDIPEEVIQTGSVSQTSYNRWGDYALLSVDPVDDETFWFSSEYVKSGGTLKGTKIASFRFGNNPVVSTLAASSITLTNATINGIVNPNGLATTYYFQWGTTISYGYSTTITSAGAGTSNIAVSSNITGLLAGTTYHFRLVATNSDGTSNGNDFSFTPGAALVSTTAITSISTNAAISGGNVITDGGSTVTERGVCWNTTANPTIANSKTSNGTGTGVYSSSITGLSANTTYHVRAYAANNTGTVYGNDVTFATLCGIFTLPFTESFPFSNPTLPNCWTINDNQGNGQVWQIGTITNQSPNPYLNSQYAYLNSDSLGSGNSQNTDLITPTINLSAYTSATLQFNYYFKSYTGSSGNLYYSINNGISWTLITSFTTTSPTNPTAFNQTISAVAGQSAVKFKWNYTGTWGYYWAIDDIIILGTPGCTLPSSAGTINGTSNVCQGQNNVVYTTATVAGATSYIWTLPSGATGTSSTTSISVNYGTSAISGNITVKGNNTCGNGTSSSLPITVNSLPSAAVTISGNITVCQGQNNVVYTVPTIANATTYIWTLPSGASGIITSNSITVNYGTSAISGNITVKGNNSCGDGTSSSLSITVNPLPEAAGAISGISTVCQGQDNVVYTVPIITNATNYLWTLPSGGTGTIISNSINVHFFPFAISGNIVVKGNNSCGNGASSLLAINVNSLPNTAGIITGIPTVCQGENNISYSIPLITNASSYIWTMPSGVSGTSSSNLINVNYGINAVSGNITVNGINSCGNGTASSMAVTVNPLPANAGIISGNDTVCQGENNLIYSVPSILNATNYVWTLASGITGNSSSNSININFGTLALSDTIFVKGNNSCGNGVSSGKTINVNPLPVDAGVISGLSTVTSGMNNVNYTVPLINNATTYVWALPGGVSGISSTNTISVNFDTNAVSGNISVKGRNSCGDGTISNIAVYVNQYHSTIRLKVTGSANSFSDETIISYGYTSDQGGSEKIFSINTTAPNLFTTKINKKWSINYLTTVTEHSEVYLGFKAGVSGNYTITSSILNSFIPATYIYLRDLTTNIVTDLSQNSSYTFTSNSNDSSNRFILIFSSQAIKWLGNISSDWNNSANWSNNSLPSISDDITLNSWTKYQPHVTLTSNTPAICNNLTIKNGASLNIEAGKALTVNGSLINNAGNFGLIIKSDTNGTGSLLHTSANVSATIERFISHSNSDEFHMLAAPIQNQSITPYFNITDGFYLWNEPGFNWIEFADVVNFIASNGSLNFLPGRGYAISYPVTVTKSFTGMLNQGNINIPVTFTNGLYRGWNFLGNPYPSAINWNSVNGWTRDILEDAISNEKAMWVWNATNGNYGAYVSNTGIGTNGVTQNIALSQGFWVKAAAAGTMSINDNARVHANQSFLKSLNSNSDIIRLTVNSLTNNYSDEIIISFGNKNEQGGAEKMFSIEAKAPGFYSKKQNKNWSINNLTTITKNPKIFLGFKPGEDGDYSISLKASQYYANILLEDLKSGEKHNLSSNSNYTFNAFKNDDPDRFVLHLSSSNEIEIVDESPFIFYSKETFNVINPWSGNTILSIYNSKGELIKYTEIKKGNFNFHFKSAQGVYIIKLVNDKNVFIKKEVVY